MHLLKFYQLLIGNKASFCNLIQVMDRKFYIVRQVCFGINWMACLLSSSYCSFLLVFWRLGFIISLSMSNLIAIICQNIGGCSL